MVKLMANLSGHKSGHKIDLIHELCPLQLLEVTKKKGHPLGLIGQHTAFGSYINDIHLTMMS